MLKVLLNLKKQMTGRTYKIDVLLLNHDLFANKTFQQTLIHYISLLDVTSST